MKTHELKTWPVYFAAIIDGSKTFEVRKNDRGFTVGDTLHLREWSHGRWERDGMRIVARSVDTPDYTGREVRRRVTYVLEGPAFGIAEGYCVLGLAPDSSREDAIDREWSLRFIALCEAAGVDPATLEDGPEALHDAIVRMRKALEKAKADYDHNAPAEDARARRETILQTLSAIMPLGMLLDDIATELDVPEARATVEEDLAALEAADLVCAHRDGGWTVPNDLDDKAWGAGIRLLAASTVGGQR